MNYFRKFLINGKSPKGYVNGEVGDVVFTDVETGKTYKSLYKMAEEFGYNSFADSRSIGTSSYHRYSCISMYVFTDGVYNFCETHECWWLHDFITSYMPYVSKIVIDFKDNGEFSYKENSRGIDDYLSIHLIKITDNSAMFTIDRFVLNETLQEEERVTICTQYIPFTDIDVDQFEWYIENGVVLETKEH